MRAGVRRKTRRRGVGAIRAVLACAICAPLLASAGCASEEPQPELIRPVLTTVLADEQGFRGRRFAGKAQAVNESNLAFEVSGKLVERPIDVGVDVERGQILARLDPRDFKAALKSAQAEHRRDATNLERGRAMLAEDVISKVQFDRLEAHTEISEANVELAAKALADSALLAPFAGNVAAIYVENFENVKAKETILRLLDMSQVEMVVQIPETLIGSAAYLQDIKVHFDAFPDVEIPATVKEIGSEALQTTRTYPVTLLMTPPGGVEILAGMTGEATGRVQAPEREADTGLEVPVAAVFADDASESDASYVWVVDDAGSSVSRRPVEMLSFGERGALVRGLAPGDRIVIAGVHSLREGQRVRVDD
jgi:RND family efflux transporter MFP subunit